LAHLLDEIRPQILAFSYQVLQSLDLADVDPDLEQGLDPPSRHHPLLLRQLVEDVAQQGNLEIIFR
jgi:hypothetical protein